MTPAQIKALVIVLLAVAFGVGGWFVVRSYNNAIESKALLENKVAQYEAAAKANAETIAELQATAKADAAILEAKESERKAYAELLATTVKDYRNDLKKLQEADRACAARTVPAPVDRMLSKGNR